MEPISATIAGLLALFGVALVVVGLFADRSRGRRRCAKCGYALDGIAKKQGSWTCPECGWSADSERAMHRTRRRPKRIAWGVAVLAVALVVAGWSRWDAAGPRVLPGAVLVRLWKLDDPDVRSEIRSRIDNGRLSKGELKVLIPRVIEDFEDPSLGVVQIASAKRILDGLLYWLAVRSEDADLEAQEPDRRLVANMLGPVFADRLLNDPNSRERGYALEPCSTLASRSVVAQHALLAAAADPDPSVAEQTRYILTQGHWILAGFVPDEVARQFGSGRMTWLRERIGPWVRERPATAETMLTLAGHLLDPSREGAEFLDGSGDTGVGAALLLSTLGPTDEVYREILGVADPDTHGLNAMEPLRLLTAFEWREGMAPVLIAAVAHGHPEMQDAGWDVIEHFGESARGMGEDLLTVIRRPGVDAERRAPRIAMEIGVPRAALRDAGLAVLRAQLEAWRRERAEPIEIDGHEFAFGGGVVDWIGTVSEPGDEEVVAVLRELVFETEPGLGCRVASAYLRASGDGEGVTRFVLDAYGRAVAGEFDDAPRRTGSRVHSAALALLFNPGLDVDAVLAWVGDDEIRAGRLVRLLAGGARGRVPDESVENIERLSTEFLAFEPARDLAERMLELIRTQRERDAEG